VTIQDLGSIGELLAAIATLATLLYLAKQIRASNLSVRAESQRAVRSGGSAMHVAIVQDPDVARIFNAGLRDFNALTPDERTRFSFLLGDLVGNAAAFHQELMLGVLPRAEFEHTLPVIEGFLRAQGGREFWKRHQHQFPRPFQKFVEKEILQDASLHGRLDADSSCDEETR
jgi:hypothetical protein